MQHFYVNEKKSKYFSFKESCRQLDDQTWEYSLPGLINPKKLTSTEALLAAPGILNVSGLTCATAGLSPLAGQISGGIGLTPMHDDILKILLDTGDLFVSSNWGNTHWPVDAQRTFSFALNMNDTFAYASADCQEMYFDQLEEVYAYWLAGGGTGLMVWSMKERGEWPIQPVLERIRRGGVWDVDQLGIGKNEEKNESA